LKFEVGRMKSSTSLGTIKGEFGLAHRTTRLSPSAMRRQLSLQITAPQSCGRE
jgi:hypothetical protein